jgi:hypothetical protein
VASQNSPWASAARFTEAVKEALMRRISIPMDVAVLVLGRSPGPNYSTQVLAARSGAALMRLCLRNYDRSRPRLSASTRFRGWLLLGPMRC